MSGAFVADDHNSIEGNASLHNLSTALFNPPLSGVGETVEGRPVLNFSLAINYAISGIHPWSYHVANILIHAANALLICLLIETIGLRYWPENRQDARRAAAFGFAAALLWGLHPLTTQSVVYVVQRAESLACFFYLLALWAGLQSMGRERDRGWAILAALSGWLGMGTKEVVATLPLVLLLLDRILVSRSWREVLSQHAGLHGAAFLGWLPLGLLVWAGSGRGGSVGLTDAIPAVVYAQTQVWAIGRYIGLAFWPFPQVFDYGTLTVTVGQWLPWALLSLGYLVITVVLLWRAPRWSLPGCFFFLFLAPTSSILPINTQTVSEHRVYLPLAALILQALLLGWTGLGLLLRQAQETEPGQQSSRKSLSLRSRVAWAALLVVAAGLATATWRRNEVYSSEFRIWQDVVQKQPSNARALYYLGTLQQARGDFDGCLQSMNESLRIQPGYLRALVHRGMLYLDQGKPELAVRDFSGALQQTGGESAAVFLQRGYGWMDLEKWPEAEADFRAAIRLDPNDPEGWHELGLALAAQGDNAQAIEAFSGAIQNSSNSESLYQRGLACLKQRQLEDAMRDFEQAILVDPQNPLGYLGRCYALLNLGRIEEARENGQRAIELGAEPEPALKERLGL